MNMSQTCIAILLPEEDPLGSKCLVLLYSCLKKIPRHWNVAAFSCHIRWLADLICCDRALFKHTQSDLIYTCLRKQEKITYLSPEEVFATGIKIVNWQILSLIAWSIPPEGLDCLIYRGFKGQR